MAQKQDKAERLATALRENLKRRKSQARAVAGEDGPEQQFKSGMDLLHAERPLSDWQRGVSMVEAASAQGLAQATERCALFEAMGVERPIDWDKALDRLALAAEQGSERAAAQLAVLARGDRFVGQPGALRNEISPDGLLGAPAVQLLSISPRIGIIEQFASAAECRWLVDSARAKLAPSTIFDYLTGELRTDERRTALYSLCNPIESGIIVEVIRARLSRAIGLPLAHFEMSQVLHYSVGQEFKPHHDYFQPGTAGFDAEIANNGQRVATQLIYLNEEFEGGETHFPSLGLTYRGHVGDALIFFNINDQGDPEPATLHTGLPPTAGEKWLFSQWIRDRRARGGTGSMAIKDATPAS
ncbi:MAG: 2OG-Fe(II) oxygenase [Sphingomicrobium sp.]